MSKKYLVVVLFLLLALPPIATAENTPNVLPCVDGTPRNTCSATKPLFCDSNRNLVAKCSVCGCKNIEVCQIANETCYGSTNYTKLVFSGRLVRNTVGNLPCALCNISVMIGNKQNTTMTNEFGKFSMILFTTSSSGFHQALMSIYDGEKTLTFNRKIKVA